MSDPVNVELADLPRDLLEQFIDANEHALFAIVSIVRLRAAENPADFGDLGDLVEAVLRSLDMYVDGASKSEVNALIDDLQEWL